MRASVINRGCYLAWVKREDRMKTKDPVQRVLLAEGGLFSGARGNLDYRPQPSPGKVVPSRSVPFVLWRLRTGLLSLGHLIN